MVVFGFLTARTGYDRHILTTPDGPHSHAGTRCLFISMSMPESVLLDRNTLGVVSIPNGSTSAMFNRSRCVREKLPRGLLTIDVSKSRTHEVGLAEGFFCSLS